MILKRALTHVGDFVGPISQQWKWDWSLAGNNTQQIFIEIRDMQKQYK